jgi:hypothetical protein
VSVSLGNVGTYVVEHFVHVVEAGEEALRVGHSHLVRNTWKAVFSADDAVICRVEPKFDCLIVMLAAFCIFGLGDVARGHEISHQSASGNTQGV